MRHAQVQESVLIIGNWKVWVKGTLSRGDGVALWVNSFKLKSYIVIVKARCYQVLLRLLQFAKCGGFENS